jgi:hypothetical protein
MVTFCSVLHKSCKVDIKTYKWQFRDTDYLMHRCVIGLAVNVRGKNVMRAVFQTKLVKW